MAAPLPCDSCGEALAAFILSNTANGETMAVCGPCAGRWGLQLALTQLAPDELMDRLQDLAPPAPVPVQEDPAPRPARKRTSRPPAAVKEEVRAPEGLAKATASAHDG